MGENDENEERALEAGQTDEEESDVGTEGEDGRVFEVVPPRHLEPERGGGGSSRGGAAVHVSRHRRRLAPPQPDNPGCYITGRYQERGGRYTFLVNQAGKHIQCWVCESLTAEDASRRHNVLYLGGDLQDDGTFTLYTFPDPSMGRGTLRTGPGDDELTVVNFGPPGQTSRSRDTLVRNMTCPTLSDDGLASLPYGETGTDAQTDRWFNNIVVAENRHPMTRQFMNWLRDQLASRVIAEKLERFFSTRSTGPDTNRNRQARALDDYIGGVFSTDPARGNNGWHPEDLDQARLAGRLLLATQQWTYEDTTRSQIEWIQIVLNRFASSPLAAHSRPLQNIQNHLGLEPRIGDEDEIYEYEAELVVGGLAGTVVIGLGIYFGSLNITASNPGGAGTRWTQSYLVWFGGFSGGFSYNLNAGFRTTGSGTSAHPWSPVEIPGHIILSSGPTISLGVGIGGSYGASVMTLFGNGVHSPLVIDFSGWSGEAEIGGGVTLIASCWGSCHSPGRRSWESRRHGYEFVQPGNRDYTVDAELQDDVHFEFGDSFLTEEGRQALRILCATELVCFDSPRSQMVVHGHADRVDTPERNERLSRLRAENTVTAINDILGEHLGIHPRNRRVIAHGESEAARAGEPDRLRNPGRRRVDIVLNARFTAALRGAAHPPRGGG